MVITRKYLCARVISTQSGSRTDQIITSRKAELIRTRLDRIQRLEPFDCAEDTLRAAIERLERVKLTVPRDERSACPEHSDAKSKESG